MSDHTGIEWTDATWNPIRGCSLVSTGCENCYAMAVAARFSGPGQAYDGLARRRSNGKPQWTGVVRVVDAHMHDPLKWKRPRRIFVNSMSDLFHENVSDDTIAKVVAVIALSPRHTFQLLTKRPARMKALWNAHVFRQLVAVNIRITAIARDLRATAPEVRDDNEWPLKNLWLGVSTENQPTADERIPELLATPAAVRFISAEPLLGPIDLSIYLEEEGYIDDQYVPPLDWVIVGGESGPNARPMHPAWARSLLDQCTMISDRTAFFFKQHGAYLTFPAASDCLRTNGPELFARVDGKRYSGTKIRFLTDDGRYTPDCDWAVQVGKKKAGRQLDGREWSEFPLEVTRGR